MKSIRPIHLNLFTIRFPITAIVSIFHRISGVILFLLVPILIWGLEFSLASQQNFFCVQHFFSNIYSKIILWLLSAAFIFHCLAGIRHLFMDAGLGENLRGARLGAYVVIILSVILIISLGYRIW